MQTPPPARQLDDEWDQTLAWLVERVSVFGGDESRAKPSAYFSSVDDTRSSLGPFSTWNGAAAGVDRAVKRAPFETGNNVALRCLPVGEGEKHGSRYPALTSNSDSKKSKQTDVNSI
jgi:hypothetical protein